MVPSGAVTMSTNNVYCDAAYFLNLGSGESEVRHPPSDGVGVWRAGLWVGGGSPQGRLPMDLYIYIYTHTYMHGNRILIRPALGFFIFWDSTATVTGSGHADDRVK